MLDITKLLTYKRTTLSPSEGGIHNSQRINIESMSCGDLSKFFEFIQSCVQTVQLNLEVISNLSLFLEFFNNCFLSLWILCLNNIIKEVCKYNTLFQKHYNKTRTGVNYQSTTTLGHDPGINRPSLNTEATLEPIYLGVV